MTSLAGLLALIALLGTGTPLAAQVDVDLVLNKSSETVTPVAGGELTYRFRVTNLSGNTATNISVTDTLPFTPSEYEFVSFTDVQSPDSAWDCPEPVASSTVVCDLPLLGPNPAADLSLDAIVDVTIRPLVNGVYANDAVVSSTEADNKPLNNQADVTVTIAAGADLVLTKTGPATVIAGAVAAYAINVTNNGPDDAVNLQVVDELPDGAQFVSGAGTDWSCLGAGLTVTCDYNATATPAALPTLTINAQLNTEGGNTNGAIASSDTTDLTPDDAQDTFLTTVTPGTDMRLTKTGPSGSLVGGGNIDYTVTAFNDGPQDASGVTVTDSLPAQVVFVSADAGCMHDGSPMGGVVTCTAGSVVNGANQIFIITVQTPVLGEMDPPVTLTNVASVSANEDDPNPGNNSDSHGFEVQTDNADLRISKSANPNPVAQGSPITFALTANNDGPGSVINPRIQDTLDASFTTIAITPGAWDCSASSGQVVDCVRTGTFGPGNLGSVTVSAVSTGANPVNNTACISGEAPVDLNSANDCSSVNVSSTTEMADLVITKADDPDPVTAGDLLTYTLTVTNNGPDPATSVSITDVLGNAQFNGVNGTPALPMNCSPSGATVTCTMNDLLMGQSDSVMLILRPRNTGTSRSNTASVNSADVGDPVRGNNSATEPTAINPAADLQVSKVDITDASDTVLAGTILTYVVTVRNNGPFQATNVSIQENLPVEVDFISATASQGSCTAPAPSDFTCNLGTLNNGQQQTVTILVRPQDLGMGSNYDIQNNVSIIPGSLPDPIDTNDSALEDTIVAPAEVDILVTKSDTTDPVALMFNTDYTVTIRNNGPSRATNVQVQDVLPSGANPGNFIYVSHNLTGGDAGDSCVQSGDAINCTLADLDSGEVLTLVITMMATIEEIVTNNVSVVSVSEADTNSDNDDASETTTARPGADLSISKTDSQDPAVVNQPFSYTLTVMNNGPAATSVTVTDMLPPNVTFNSASMGCLHNSGIVTCDLGVINSGGMQMVTVNVTPTQAGMLTNTASVSGSNPDPFPVNNSTSEPTNVIELPNFTIQKTANGPFTQGQTASFSIVVSNTGAGPSDGTSVTVTDAIPAPLVLTGATGTGWTCSAIAPNISCTRMEVLGPASSFPVITATVSIPSGAPPQTVINTATVMYAGPLGETSTADNSAMAPAPINNGADLTIGKAAVGAPWTAGDTARQYQLTVTNSGTGDTDGAIPTVVTDLVPAGFSVAGTPSGMGWNCTASSGNNVSCTRSEALLMGASYPVIAVAVDVGPNTVGQQDNTASVSGGGDGNTSNNSANAMVTVLAPDLTIDKASGPLTAGMAGETFTLSVSNVGDADVQAGEAVVVTDMVPAALQVTGVSGTGWDCMATSGQNVSCTRSDGLVQAMSYPLITVTVTVADSAIGPINNTGTVSAPRDSNSNNNSDVESITILIPDLTITKTATDAPWTAGDTGREFQIVVTNSGTGAVQADDTVTVTDTVPDDLQVSAVSGTGWTCAAPSQNVSCSRTEALAIATSYPVISVTVSVSDTASTSVDNTANVATDGAESNSNNNSDPETVTILVPDLTILKTADDTPWTAGDTGREFQIVVTNSGTGAVQADDTVTVTDTVPDDLQVSAVSGTGWDCMATSGQDISCSRTEALAIATSYPAISVTVSVSDTAPTPIDNTANVATDGAESNSDNNSDPETVTILVPDLTILKTADDTPWTAGDTGRTYELAVSNVGDGATQPGDLIQIDDLFPDEVTVTGVSATGWDCSAWSGQSVSCFRTDVLAVGASFPLVVVSVDVPISTSGPALNTAGVTTDGADANSNNDSDDASVNVLIPNLTVAKNAIGADWTAGDMGRTFELVVSNTGDGATQSGDAIRILDTVSDLLSLTGATGTGWDCSATAGQLVDCSRSDALAAGASFPTVVVTVAVKDTTSGSVPNSASVSTDGADSDSSDNSGSTSVDVTIPDLTINKTAVGDFISGMSASYTIVVSNVGSGLTQPDDVITVADNVPAPLVVSSAAGIGWDCSATVGQSVSCSRSDVLAPGGSYPPITLNVDISATFGGSISNTAVVQTDGADSSTQNNSDVEPTVVTGADLTIQKSHRGPFFPLESGTYVLIVRNIGQGPTDGSAVTVSDVVPAGLTPRSASGLGWNCSTSAQMVSCTRSDSLPANQNYPEIQVVVGVSRNVSFPLTNTAVVGGGGDDTPENNQDSDTVRGPNDFPDLKIRKSHRGEFTRGGEGVFTLKVTNVGIVASIGRVEVRDALPAGLIGLAASGPGWSCNIVSNTLACSRSDSLEAFEAYPPIELTVRAESNAPEQIINTASVEGEDDTNGSNNTDSDSVSIPPVNGPDPTIHLTSVGPFVPGQEGTYAISVCNVGDQPTDGSAVVVRSTLVDWTVPVAAGGPGWACTVVGQTLECARTEVLEPGECYPPITVDVLIAEDAPEVITNVANVSGGGDLNPDNNISTDTVIRSDARPDPTISKTHSPGTFVPGEEGTYILSVSNVGDAPTNGVVRVIDDLPVGLTVLDVFAKGWDCLVTERKLVCERDDKLETGAAYPDIVVTVRVAPDAPDVVTNIVRVSGGGDHNPSNNVGRDDATVDPEGDAGDDEDMPMSKGFKPTWFDIETLAGITWPLEGVDPLEAYLAEPEDVVVDANGVLYISSTRHRRVVRIDLAERTVRIVYEPEDYDKTGPRGPITDELRRDRLGLAVDSLGSLYVADSLRNVVVKIDPDGEPLVIAGTGEAGFAGDGGPALQAMLDHPVGIDVDGQGHLYVADRDNDRIRLLVPSGIISTIAGGGISSDGFGDDGPATDAQLHSPVDVAVSFDGDIFVAERGAGRVRRISGDGMIDTILGSDSGQPQLLPSQIAGLAVDRDGQVFVSDRMSHRILRIESDGAVSVVSGDGELGFSGDGPESAEPIRHKYPAGLSVSPDQTLYIADTKNQRIRTWKEGTIHTVAGRSHLAGDGGPAVEASLDTPYDIAVSKDWDVYIADAYNHVVRLYHADGTITTVAGTGVCGYDGEDLIATESRLHTPTGLVLHEGVLYIADAGNRRIRFINEQGRLQTLAGNGEEGDSGDGGPTLEARFRFPQGISAYDDRLYVADSRAHRVRVIRFNADLETQTHTIEAFAGTGQPGYFGDGGPALEAQLHSPVDVEVDWDGQVYIADSLNHRVRLVRPEGFIETFAGDGRDLTDGDGGPAVEAGIALPLGLTLDPVERIYIADGGGQEIRRVNHDGIIERVAGTRDEPGFRGDGDRAERALLNGPRGMDFYDPTGILVVADHLNDRIRKLLPVPPRVTRDAVVNAASFMNERVAPEEIISIFGDDFAPQAMAADSQPLPKDLWGTQVLITDSVGITHAMPLFYVSANQINALIPAEVALGPAVITVRSANGQRGSTQVDVQPIAPGVFSADASGTGLAAALALRISADGSRTPVEVFRFSDDNALEAVPIDLGPEGDQVVLSLFATGLRRFSQSVEATIGGEPAEVLGAVAQSEFAGLDQINIVIRRSLAGAGVTPVELIVDGVKLNVVTVTIQ